MTLSIEDAVADAKESYRPQDDDLYPSLPLEDGERVELIKVNLGAWHARHRHLLKKDALDMGCRTVVAHSKK